MCADLRRSRGFTLVEVMVGVLIALLIGIAATSTAMLYSSSQRTGMGGSVANANVTSVLSAIAEDVAQAGLGFVPTGTFACDTLHIPA